MQFKLPKAAVDDFGLVAIGIRSPLFAAFVRAGTKIVLALELHRLVDQQLHRVGHALESIFSEELDSIVSLAKFKPVGHEWVSLRV